MFDISKCGIKPFEFTDGNKVYVTRNPSQKLYIYMATHKDDEDTEEVFKLVDSVCNYMIKDEDKAVLTDLDMTVKLALMQEYFQYHVSQLEGGFSSTSGPASI